MSDLSHHPTTTVFRGTILRETDAAYDDARRVFNGLIDRRPDRILRCHSTEDVVAALNAARFEGQQISLLQPGRGDSSSRQLERRGRTARARDTPRAESVSDADDAPVAVEEDDVDREPHEEHVYRGSAVDQHPAAVAFPESASQVAALVEFARYHGLKVAPHIKMDRSTHANAK